MRQPLVSPTSMYSMKRTMCPLPLKCRAMGTIESSLTPRFTTMLILSGARPAAAAARCPASTSATGKSTSFMRRNVASSSESRLTVTRLRPASRRLCAFFASSEPFVVSVRSRSREARQHLDQLFEIAAQQRLAAGQPDLAHAQVDEDPGDARDFLERQQLGVGQECVVAAEHLLRHAIDAAEIAAIGDRDAQVAHAAAARVRAPVPALATPALPRARTRRARPRDATADSPGSDFSRDDRGHAFRTEQRTMQMVADDRGAHRGRALVAGV